MRLRHWGLVILFLACGRGGAWSQSAPPVPQDLSGAAQETPQPSMPRPTLGPAPPPSLGGGRALRISDARRFMQVRKVFVQRIDNNLSEKLIEALTNASLFEVVPKIAAADAVVRGSCFEARRLRKVHTEIYLTDRASGKIIWQDVIRKRFNPPPLAGAVDATVVDIVADLRADIGEAPQVGD